MFWSLHATKGGIGTSVIAAGLALELAQREPWSARHGVVLVDFCGDQPDICGVDVGERHGVVDWLCAPEPVDVASLETLLVPVVPGLSLLPMGRSSLPNDVGAIDTTRITELVQGLGGVATVVADLGVIDAAPASPRAVIGAASDRRTLALRPCYLALRRATRVPISFDNIVEVFEDGRSLRTLDVEAVMGMAVSARVRVDPAIARAVDSGTLVSRRPRHLRRFIADVLDEFAPDGGTGGLAELGREGRSPRSRSAVESW